MIISIALVGSHYQTRLENMAVMPAILGGPNDQSARQRYIHSRVRGDTPGYILGSGEVLAGGESFRTEE